MQDPTGRWFQQDGERGDPPASPPADFPAPSFFPPTTSSSMPNRVAPGTPPVAFEIPERHHRWVWFVAAFLVLLIILTIVVILHLVG